MLSNSDSKSTAEKEEEEEQEEDPDSLQTICEAFSSLKLTSFEYLYSLKERQACPSCKLPRKYFCYDCLEILGDKSQIPSLQLCVDVDIIHHPKEMRSKSTAIHAKLLAPDNVAIYEFPQFPDYSKERDSVLLLFPSEDAQFVEDVDMSVIATVKKLVVIDSTWQQSKTILRHQQLKGLKCVKLHTHHTMFWRYQTFGDDYLATIEAIYYFLREFYSKLNGSYDGRYDNLLFYFVYFYDLIQGYYKSNKEKVFRKEKGDYIKY